MWIYSYYKLELEKPNNTTDDILAHEDEKKGYRGIEIQ